MFESNLLQTSTLRTTSSADHITAGLTAVRCDRLGYSQQSAVVLQSPLWFESSTERLVHLLGQVTPPGGAQEELHNRPAHTHTQHALSVEGGLLSLNCDNRWSQ